MGFVYVCTYERGGSSEGAATNIWGKVIPEDKNLRFFISAKNPGGLGVAMLDQERLALFAKKILRNHLGHIFLL